MSGLAIHYRSITPLFGLPISERFQFRVPKPSFADKKTLHLLDEPVRVHPKPESTPKPKTMSFDIPAPRTMLRLLPWDSGSRASTLKELELSELPDGIDEFSGLGDVAFRAGAGGLGGYQIQTTAPRSRSALSLAVVDLEQEWPSGTEVCSSSPVNPFHLGLIDSFFDALRLRTGFEPAATTTRYWLDGDLTDAATRWPLFDFALSQALVEGTVLRAACDDFLSIWRIRSSSRNHVGCRVMTLALETYYLASIMPATCPAFLHLMIAFEALFKRREERRAKPAATRISAIVSDTEEQFRETLRFMYCTDEGNGCCQIRNDAAHGSTSALRSGTHARLQFILRGAILRICSSMVAGDIEVDDYYASLSRYCDEREGLLVHHE